jgi:hypothetical protein
MLDGLKRAFGCLRWDAIWGTGLVIVLAVLAMAPAIAHGQRIGSRASLLPRVGSPSPAGQRRERGHRERAVRR